MSSGFNVIRRHSLDATGVRIKELTQALATSRSKLEGSQLETDDIRSQGRMDHSTIKLNDERLSFGTTIYGLDTDYTFEFPQEPDLKYLKCWYMLDHLGARIRDVSGFGNDAYVSGHPTLRRAPLDLGFQQLPNAPGTPVMLFNSGTDVVSQIDGEYIWIPDNATIQFSKYQNGFSIHFRFCCLNFESHYPTGGGSYSRRFASKTDDANNAWSVLVYSTGTNTGGVEVEIKHNGIDYAKATYGYRAGMWYQVVVTYDPNAGATQTERIKIYTAGNENSIDSTFGTIPSTTYNLRIGARSSSTGFFHGYIHDFRMWFDKVLTQDEINNINRNELTIEPIEKGHVFIVQYALVQGLLKSKRHVWDVVGRILKVRSHRYNILTRVAAAISKIHKWNIKIKVSLLKIHEYNIIEIVQRLLTIIYDQGGALTSPKTHKWNVIGKITRTHTHRYDVSGLLTTLTTQYQRFTKSTSAGSNITQDVTFTGKPQALIVWSEGTTANNTFSEGYQFYYGFSDGTNHGCLSSFAADNVTTSDMFSGHKSDKVIALMNTTLGTVASEATVSFIDTNTARFNWTTNDNRAVYVHCLAIWGITAAEVNTFAYGRITTGNQTYTLNNASLLPKFIHTITRSATASWSTSIGNAAAIGSGISDTKRWSVANTGEDARTTSSEVYARGYYSEASVVAAIDDDTGAVEGLANVSSFSTGSFVLNWTDAPPASTSVFSALVLDTGSDTGIIDVGSFNEPASTGIQNISVAATVNQVKGVMIFTNGQATSGITNDSIMSIGAGTGTGATEQGCVSVGDDDVSGATRTARINKTGSIIKTIFPDATASSSTTNNEASLSALGTDQFSLNWSTRSGTRRCHYIVFCGAAGYEVTKTQIHKYNVIGKVTRTHTHKYNVTGIESYTEIYNVSSSDLYLGLGVQNSRVGERFLTGCTMIGITPKKVTMKLANMSSLTGTAYLRIRNSGDSIVSEFGSIDVSTIGTSPANYTITNNSQSHTMAAGDRLMLEYTHGSSNLYVYLLSSNPYANANRTNYDGSYNSDGFEAGDITWIIYY